MTSKTTAKPKKPETRGRPSSYEAETIKTSLQLEPSVREKIDLIKAHIQRQQPLAQLTITQVVRFCVEKTWDNLHNSS